jgi:RNA polymerase sigma-70 factor (ECF subfamily)
MKERFEAAGALAPSPRLSFDSLNDHRESVLRICLGFCSSYEEAEDLAQDVYVRAYRGLGKLERPDLAKLWLFRIARNAGLDHKKTLRRRSQLLRTWANDEISTGTVRSENPPVPDARLAGLKSAIRRLPSRFREVFVLREYGNLSYEEIARTLGIETGTVMSRLARSRKKIAAAIEGTSR